jgi:hypothetical protein
MLLLGAVDQAMADAGRWAFITLTYHLREVTARESKDDLDDLKKRLRRCFGERVCGIWKLEPQKRGKPHFHLLLHLGDGVSHGELRRFFIKHWHAVAEPDSPEHLRVLEWRSTSDRGTRREFYQPMRSWSQVAGYAAKYCGKLITNDPDWSVPGRFWGVVCKRAFRRLTCVSRIRCSDAAAVWVARQLRRYEAHRETGRIDVIIPGRRLTLDRELCKVPGFVDGQASLARALGGTLKRYRYRPNNSRNRSGFVPGALVKRLALHAVALYALSEHECLEDARNDLDRMMRPLVDDQRAHRRLRVSIPRLARSMRFSRQAPPPESPQLPLSLFPEVNHEPGRRTRAGRRRARPEAAFCR